MRPHRRQPTKLPRPWDSPDKNTGVGCHFLLQCMKVKRESEVAQSCPTLSDPMDCSLPGSSVHGIFQARLLEWGAISFSVHLLYCRQILYRWANNCSWPHKQLSRTKILLFFALWPMPFSSQRLLRSSAWTSSTSHTAPAHAFIYFYLYPAMPALLSFQRKWSPFSGFWLIPSPVPAKSTPPT